MKKIALILTGGTIGSFVEEHIIDVGEQSIYKLTAAYEDLYKEQNILEIFSPFQSLSENFTKREWQKLYDFLYAFPFEKYEGVVIAHGTDTLAYTSALVGMLFGHVTIPILLIASNYPVGHPKSNGVTNLRAAVELIRQGKIRGVFSVYENDKEEVEIHLATRMIPADNVRDQYGSFGGECFGKMLPRNKEKKNFILQLSNAAHNPTLEQLQKVPKAFFQSKLCFEKDILFLMPYPGQNYDSIVPGEGVAAVYHYLYHAGTACTKGEKYSFLAFVKRCSKQGIPVYVASLKKEGMDSYATQDALLKEGVYPMFDISPVAGYIKLVLAYSQTEKTVEEICESNLFYEQII